jgi:hypothetical protein
MKPFIGIGVFDKPDMLQWILEGVRDSFPGEKTVWFYFEDQKEYMVESLQEAMQATGFQPHECVWAGQIGHIYEQGIHRFFLEHFMESDCDVLVIPHDDNKFTRFLMPDLLGLWNTYGKRLGWVGGRDGYDFGYSGMVCSPFSLSDSTTKERIPVGEWREVRMLNTGPNVYFRHVVEKVGLPDPDMPWYWWDEYSLRCEQAGLQNVLLSMDCLHEKFGRVTANPAELYNDKLVADCLKRLNEKWLPVYGRNVI